MLLVFLSTFILLITANITNGHFSSQIIQGLVVTNVLEEVGRDELGETLCLNALRSGNGVVFAGRRVWSGVRQPAGDHCQFYGRQGVGEALVTF